MSRRQNDPLRPLTPNERNTLTRLSRSLSAPAAQVERARALLAIADGATYTAAAHQVGRRHTETISAWVSRFNRDGLAAVRPGHGGGARIHYGAEAQQRILAEWVRTPQRDQDGTATWSVSLLQRTLRQADDGLPRVSTYTIWRTLHEAGLSWQKSRTWCETGVAMRQRKHGLIRRGARQRSRCFGQKKLIEQAYTLGAQFGLSVWCEDEAGPFQAVPHSGPSWQPRDHPAQHPHESIRGGTTKVLTLFHPASGQVRLQPATRCTNAVLHPWLRERLSAILAALPPAGSSQDAAATPAAWAVWQAGLTTPFTLPEDLPPLRLLLVWDNLTGHKTPDLVLWLCAHGVMPLYTPVGGSWLNMAESIERVLKRRALDGQHPHSPDEIGTWFEQTARAWNGQPTPFVWNGKRRQRRRRSSGAPIHRLGGSGASTHKPLRRSRSAGSDKCQTSHQMTH